jgi:hypothetical protein
MTSTCRHTPSKEGARTGHVPQCKGAKSNYSIDCTRRGDLASFFLDALATGVIWAYNIDARADGLESGGHSPANSLLEAPDPFLRICRTADVANLRLNRKRTGLLTLSVWVPY